jgi:hypothetical protein
MIYSIFITRDYNSYADDEFAVSSRPGDVARERHLLRASIVPSTKVPAHEVRMRRQEALAHITSSLVGGLVLSYLLFAGYVMTIAQRSHSEPTRTSAMGCFAFGHCPVAGIRRN